MAFGFYPAQITILYFLVAGKVIVVGKGEVVQAGSLHGKGPSFLDFNGYSVTPFSPAVK